MFCITLQGASSGVQAGVCLHECSHLGNAASSALPGRACGFWMSMGSSTSASISESCKSTSRSRRASSSCCYFADFAGGHVAARGLRGHIAEKAVRGQDAPSTGGAAQAAAPARGSLAPLSLCLSLGRLACTAANQSSVCSTRRASAPPGGCFWGRSSRSICMHDQPASPSAHVQLAPAVSAVLVGVDQLGFHVQWASPICKSPLGQRTKQACSCILRACMRAVAVAQKWQG